MLQGAKQTFRYYEDLHNKKINERRQALITKFITPVMPDEPAEEPVPGTSAEEPMLEEPSLPSAEELLTEEEMEEFEGYISKAGGTR